ncbi:MAG: protein kinase [Candidatus Obscuribacter sp.]|nr:protein kinase [Candidatus Obscuribacter sp.]
MIETNGQAGEEELERFGSSDPCLAQLSGLQVGDYFVEALHKTGQYSQVYSALSLKSGNPVAIKRPCKGQGQDNPFLTGVFLTGAYACDLGGPRAVEACPESVFLAQLESLCEISHPHIIPVLECSRRAGTRWLAMPFLSGPTLRQAMTHLNWQESLALVEQLAKALSEVNGVGWHHMDLKPENILLSAGGPVLIDPGYRGALRLQSGKTVEACVTTPVYNPGPEPSDIEAFGLILFELVTGILPTMCNRAPETSDAGESLLNFIEEHEVVGNFNFSRMRYLQRPSKIRSDCSPMTESILLNVLGLELRNDRIEVKDSQKDWSEIAALLEKLRNER